MGMGIRCTKCIRCKCEGKGVNTVSVSGNECNHSGIDIDIEIDSRVMKEVDQTDVILGGISASCPICTHICHLAPEPVASWRQ
jgi:hypothetical protein